MNSKELGLYLREARLLKSISLNRFAETTIYSVQDFVDFENGKKSPLKVMTKYLSCLDTYFWFKHKDDVGKLSFDGYFTVFKKAPYKVPTLTTFDFLQCLNKNDIIITLNKDDFPVGHVFQSYPDQSIIDITNKVCKSMKRSMTDQRIDLPTLAKSIHMTNEALDYFLYGVVDFDFRFVDVVCRKCALKLIVKTKDDKRFSLVMNDKGLCKEIKINNKKKHFLLKSGDKITLTEAAQIIQELNYKSLHFSLLKNVEVECRKKADKKENKKIKDKKTYIKFISVPMGGQNKKY